jgi:hypothetical protein
MFFNIWNYSDYWYRNLNWTSGNRNCPKVLAASNTTQRSCADDIIVCVVYVGTAQYARSALRGTCRCHSPACHSHHHKERYLRDPESKHFLLFPSHSSPRPITLKSFSPPHGP